MGLIKTVDNQKGFSLVELMVTCGIIGIMTSIAFPAYSYFAARARQSEAKIDLSAIYAAEEAFYADKGGYTCCLYQTGYSPGGQVFFYFSGFYNNNGACITSYDFDDPAAICNLGAAVVWSNTLRNDAAYNMNSWANRALTGAGIGGAYMATSSTFNATAFGSIDVNSPILDVWQIDQSKNLLNQQSGY